MNTIPQPTKAPTSPGNGHCYDYAEYLDMFNGDFLLALHWFNEQEKAREAPPLTEKEARILYCQWRGF